MTMETILARMTALATTRTVTSVPCVSAFSSFAALGIATFSVTIASSTTRTTTAATKYTIIISITASAGFTIDFNTLAGGTTYSAFATNDLVVTIATNGARVGAASVFLITHSVTSIRITTLTTATLTTSADIAATAGIR